MAEGDTSKILDSVKAALGLQPDYTPFDTDVLMHINSTVAILNQLGVGPGFEDSDQVLIVTADTTWNALLTGDKLESVKSYMFLKVKMFFDINTMPGPVISAYERLITEMEWRLSVASDPMIPQLAPDLDDLEDEELILDGGGP